MDTSDLEADVSDFGEVLQSDADQPSIVPEIQDAHDVENQDTHDVVTEVQPVTGPIRIQIP